MSEGSRPLSSLRAELSRKGIHLTTSLVPLAYGLGVPRGVVLGIVAALLALLVVLEITRRRPGVLARCFDLLCGYMLRDHEVKGLLGSTWYCLSSLLCIALMPRPVAVLALLYLAYGDTAASFVGRTWGRTRIGHKSLEGTLGFVAMGTAIAVVARGCSPEYKLAVGLVGAVAAALAELLLTRWDDNLTIPIVSGAVMTGMAILIGA